MSQVNLTSRVRIKIQRCVNDTNPTNASIICATNEEIDQWIEGKSIRMGAI